jgi:hypothetical protein
MYFDFRLSKSKGQVISHVMCHVQVMWWIMGLVMWWVRWHITWWLTNASRAPTRWLSCWLSAKPWWLTAEDVVSNCGHAYCSDDSLLMNPVMWLLFSSCIKDCSLPGVPISTSCGFGTQVSIVDYDVLCTQSNLWFWDSGSEPTSVTCATVPSCIETLILLTSPFL